MTNNPRLLLSALFNNLRNSQVSPTLLTSTGIRLIKSLSHLSKARVCLDV